MSTVTDWRLESSPHPRRSRSSADPSAVNESASHRSVAPQSFSRRDSVSTVPPDLAAELLARPKVSSMYSPISLAFFGLTGTAVGAAGLSGSFGGLTSLLVTGAVLLVLFTLLLVARTVARRRVAGK